MYDFTIVMASLHKDDLCVKTCFVVGKLKRNCGCIYMVSCFHNYKCIFLHVYMQMTCFFGDILENE